VEAVTGASVNGGELDEVIDIDDIETMMIHDGCL